MTVFAVSGAGKARTSERGAEAGKKGALRVESGTTRGKGVGGMVGLVPEGTRVTVASGNDEGMRRGTNAARGERRARWDNDNGGVIERVCDGG